MSDGFHERFEIEVGIDEVRRRFINRVYNLIFEGFIRREIPDWMYLELLKYVAARLGDQFAGNYLAILHGGHDFLRHLQAIESVYAFIEKIKDQSVVHPTTAGRLSIQIQEILDMSEVDLGVRWDSGRFLRAGAALLDAQLVNDPLRWLADRRYESVLTPYRKGLDHLLRSTGQPQLRADVVTDMYEALEALVKIVVRKDADLSKNREAFVSTVRASDEFKDILQRYIKYANDFRHAVDEGKKKPELSEREVESFVYLTGVFIRLAMP